MLKNQIINQFFCYIGIPSLNNLNIFFSKKKNKFMLKICINHKSFFINNIIFLHSLLFFYFSKKKSIRQAYLCVKRFKIKIVLKLHCCNFSDWQIFAFKVLSKFKDPLGIQRFKKIKKHKNQKKIVVISLVK